jgi:hypothetical protein
MTHQNIYPPQLKIAKLKAVRTRIGLFFSSKNLLGALLLVVWGAAFSSSQAVSLSEFPEPRREAPPPSSFYGYAPGRDSLGESSWFAHTSSNLGAHGLAHASFFEEHPDFFRIRLGHPTNFHRSYLPLDLSLEIPGLTKPGRIIARVRRDNLSEEVKMVAFGKAAFGVRVANGEISDIYGDGKIAWDYKDAGWQDWILDIKEDGGAEFRIGDGPTLVLNPRPNVHETLGKMAQYVTFGHKRMGPQRFLDIAELHFLPHGVAKAEEPKSVLPEGRFLLRYKDGTPHVAGETKAGQPDGWFEVYWPNGVRSSAGRYSGGQKEGVWSYWTREGQLASIETYEAGVLHGPLVLYSLTPGENSRRVAEYREGKPVSERVEKQNPAVTPPEAR